MYRFNDAANAVYKFVWNTFCDWYVELSKPVLQGGDGTDKDEARATTAFVIDEIAKLLHPFMPFITEELWAIKGEQGAPRESLLCLAQWPQYQGLENELAKTEINWLIEAISQIRSARAEMSVPAGSQIPLVIVNAGDAVKEQAACWNDALKRLARLSDISFSENAPPQSVQIVMDSCVLALPLVGIIDMEAERARLIKEQEKQLAEIAKVDAKLGNADFVARAPEEIIEENRARKQEAEQRVDKIKDALAQLG